MLRAARARSDREFGAQIVQYARHELEKNRSIERKNVMLVEHYLRKGKKQLKTLEEGSIQRISNFSSAKGTG